MSGSSGHSHWSHSSICMQVLTTVLMMCDEDGVFATYFKKPSIDCAAVVSTRTMHQLFAFLSNREWKLTCKRKHWSPCRPAGKISTRLLQFIAFLSGLSRAHDNFLWPGGLFSGRQNLMVWRTTGRRPLQIRVMEKAVNRSLNGEGRQQAVHEIEKAVNRFMIVMEKAGNRYMRWNRLATESWAIEGRQQIHEMQKVGNRFMRCRR